MSRLGDNLKTVNDFPAQRERGSLLEFGPRRQAGADHHRPFDKPVGQAYRHGIDDDFQRGPIRGMAVTLTVNIFGLDSELSGFGEEVHSARGLHAKLLRLREIL
jgi:hypothetical protein